MTLEPEPPAETAAEAKAPTTARAGGIMMVSILLSRVLGMMRDSVMTAMFGVSLATEAYNLAVTIPDTLFMLIAGGGLSSAFIPVFSELYYTDRRKEAWRFFSVVTTVCSIVVVLLVVGAWQLAPTIGHFIAAGEVDAAGHNISREITPHLVTMGRILLPAQFAFLIGSLLLGTLYARRQFLAPGLAPNVYNIGIIAGAVIGGLTPLGIAGMPWGGLLGAMIGNLALPIFFMSRQDVEFRPSLDLKAEGVRKFFVLLAPVILGFSLPSVCQLITNYFAASYPAPSVTILRLSSTLMLAPNGIFGQSLALAAFPVLTQFYTHKRMDAYRDEMTRTLCTVIYLAIPSMAIMLALAPQIVQVLLGYGKASRGPHQLADIAFSLRVYSVGVVAWCVQPVLMRGFFSAQKTLGPIALSTGMTALFIGLCFGAKRFGLPLQALAVSADIAAILLAMILYTALTREVGRLDLKGILTTGVKAILGATVMGLFAWGTFWALNLAHVSRSKILMIPSFLVVLSASIWVYYFATRALQMPETSYFDRAFRRLRRA